MYMSDALHINNAKASRLARKLAKQTGETITDAIIHALEERLERSTARQQAGRDKRFQRIMEIVNEIQKLPVLDDRPADEIIGYNENGHFD
jgi:antitoxin VapB